MLFYSAYSNFIYKIFTILTVHLLTFMINLLNFTLFIKYTYNSVKNLSYLVITAWYVLKTYIKDEFNLV